MGDSPRIGGSSHNVNQTELQPLQQEELQEGVRHDEGSFRHRIVKRIKKAIVSPIRTAIHQARYHPKGTVPRPPLNRPIESRDIQHLTESRQLLSEQKVFDDAEGHTLAKLFTLEERHYDSALRVLELWKDTQAGGYSDKKILNLEQQLKNEKKLQREQLLLKGEQGASKPDIKHAKKLGENLRSRLASAGIPETVVDSNYKYQLNKKLNEREWKVLHKVHDTNAGRLEHRQVPAAKMQLQGVDGAQGGRDIHEESYDGLGGISSQTTDSRVHAVDLWTSSFKTPKGKFNYNGVRHGIHSAFGIKDAATRKEANINRAKESLVAALTLKPELLGKALANPQQSIQLDLTSTSLVTPDAIRKGAKSEAKMLKEQMEAFDQLSSQRPLKLTVVDQNGKATTIRVNFRMATFNFGVNKGAQKKYLTPFVGGWKTSDKYNKQGLTNLLGSTKPGEIKGIVGDYLAKQQAQINELTAEYADDKVPIEKKAEISAKIGDMLNQRRVVEQLAAQTRSIFNSKAHHSEGHDTYKMPARILLLTSLIEGVPLSNCKSGKDRTGMLDAEVKLLATMTERDGKVPEPGARLSPEDAALFREILIHSQNLKIQEYNTGAEGYKTEGIDSIDEHIGKEYLSKEEFKAYRARVRGLSGAVQA
ncbi:inositol phosphate phosphatase SopB [Spongorhabdus nitratireducens]